jgi:preprotein translocase subunit SecE
MNAQVNSSNKALGFLKWFVVVSLVLVAIGGNFYFSAESLILRVVGVLVLLVAAVGVALTTDQGRMVARLRKEAWVEVRKVVWPTRQETLQTTGIVVIFVAVVALVLWLVDMLLGWGVSFIIG